MTATTRSYEDVKEGEQLPALTRTMSVARMMIYGASTWDFIRLHYDEGFAKSKGEARRLIAGGGARVDGEKVSDEALTVAVRGDVRVSAGKKHHGVLRASTNV